MLIIYNSQIHKMVGNRLSIYVQYLLPSFASDQYPINICSKYTCHLHVWQPSAFTELSVKFIWHTTRNRNTEYIPIIIAGELFCAIKLDVMQLLPVCTATIYRHCLLLLIFPLQIATDIIYCGRWWQPV